MLWTVGCGGVTEVDVQGRLVDAPSAAGEALVGASVALWDDAGEELLDETQTNENGLYRVVAPVVSVVHLEVSGEGLLPASFTGATGINPRFRVGDADVFGLTEAVATSWQETFSGCPSSEGGLVFGEVRILDILDPDTGEYPVVTKAFVEVELSDGTRYEACYLDDDGVFDAEADRTGDTGRFWIPDVPAGVHRLVVSYDVFGQYDAIEVFPIRVIEGGAAPRFPAWVPFAF